MSVVGNWLRRDSGALHIRTVNNNTYVRYNWEADRYVYTQLFSNGYARFTFVRRGCIFAQAVTKNDVFIVGDCRCQIYNDFKEWRDDL